MARWIVVLMGTTLVLSAIALIYLNGEVATYRTNLGYAHVEIATLKGELAQQELDISKTVSRITTIGLACTIGGTFQEEGHTFFCADVRAIERAQREHQSRTPNS